MFKFKEVKKVTAGKNGVRLAKIVVTVAPLRGIRVTKTDKGYGYQLPQGSYRQNGEMVYTKPLFPVNPKAMHDDIVTVMQSTASVLPGTFYPLTTSDPANIVQGFVALNEADIVMDVSLMSDGTLMMPTAIRKKKDEHGHYVLDDKGNPVEEKHMLIPLKNDDPERAAIIDAIVKFETAE